MKISHQELTEILSYDPESGILRWIKRRSPCAIAGQVAGHVSKRRKNHSQIIINGRSYGTHRIAWFHYYGKWPSDQIDHIDGNGMNNSISNLREANNSQNCCNRRGWSGTGVKGVTLTKLGRFYARIKKDKKHYSLGTYGTLEEAAAAYENAAGMIHGEFARLR